MLSERYAIANIYTDKKSFEHFKYQFWSMFFPWVPHSMKATLNKLHKNFHVDCTKETEKNTNSAKKVVEDN